MFQIAGICHLRCLFFFNASADNEKYRVLTLKKFLTVPQLNKSAVLTST